MKLEMNETLALLIGVCALLATIYLVTRAVLVYQDSQQRSQARCVIAGASEYRCCEEFGGTDCKALAK